MTKDNKIFFKTPSQTVGPFFRNYLNFNFDNNINFYEITNNQIIISIKIKDKKEDLVKDAFIEYWQILKNNHKLLYFNRTTYCDKEKSYLIHLNEYNSDNIIYLGIFARGLLNHLNTIIFLEDANFYREDNFFKQLPISRRNLMIARFKKFKNNIKYYNYDLYLSGVKETVFFNFEN